ncbi:MAG: FAD-binding protein [Eggerthellaceae bacterium]|nr:FAD-binding protein [Eggerthellaceae bacterium]
MDYTEKLNLTRSRRSFIKAAGAAVFAGAAAVAMGGCATKQADANPNTYAESLDDISWDEETDVLIVGGGLAGHAAAATVATEGQGAKCLLIEKGCSPLGFGDSPFSAGRVLWTDDEHAEGFRSYLYELRGDMDNTPDAVLDAFAAGIHENRTWLESLPGFDANDVSFEEHFVPGSGKTCYPEYPELEHGYNLGVLWFKGEQIDHVIKFVHQVIEQYPDVVTHKINARLTALVQDPSTKAVVGGVYEYEDNTIYVKANKGVIMSCGGFENNAQMRADYLSGTTARCIAGRENEGDGHYICARIGADMWHMNSCAGFWTSVSPIEGPEVTMRTPKQFGITVAPNGRRFFMDWDSDHEHDWEDIPNHPIDINVGSRHGHMQFGGEWPHLPMPKDTWYILDDDGYNAMMAYETAPSFDPSSDGYGFTANTIEELASKAGIISEELVKTVELWNQYCEAGEDPAFHRPAKTLTPITKAPFHACHCSTTMLNTDGGPRRDEHARIIDLNGDPIPNLFSAGEFGSVWCNMYNGGGNLGECCAFGRIAVRSCLGLA